jgi:hypothetical protein
MAMLDVDGQGGDEVCFCILKMFFKKFKFFYFKLIFFINIIILKIIF